MTRDRGYDEFLDAVAAGEPYYLASPDGGGWLPPRSVDPETGARDLSKAPLPEPGELLTSTVTHVAPPGFVDDAPYEVAIAAFGPVRLTGQLRGELTVGDAVTVGVERTTTTDERVLVFHPV